MSRNQQYVFFGIAMIIVGLYFLHSGEIGGKGKARHTPDGMFFWVMSLGVGIGGGFWTLCIGLKGIFFNDRMDKKDLKGKKDI